MDYDPWIDCNWSFTFPNQTGYYRFYSCAADNSSNVEGASVLNDTGCGYDTQAPNCLISYNRSATYFKANDPLKINVIFTENYSGINESSVRIAISTMGNGGLINSSMSMVDNTHWYYNWMIPSGSDDDGLFSVFIYARDIAGNNLPLYPTIDTSRQIDNSPPVISSLTATNISSSSVTISWMTNENASSHVAYGPAFSYRFMVS